jgi:hypothetical protein
MVVNKWFSLAGVSSILTLSSVAVFSLSAGSQLSIKTLTSSPQITLSQALNETNQHSTTAFDLSFLQSLESSSSENNTLSGIGLSGEKAESKNSEKLVLKNSSDDDHRSADKLQVVIGPKQITKTNSPAQSDKIEKPETENTDGIETIPMKGFASTSLANGSTDVDVRQDFSLTFTTPPSKSLVDSLRFYPPAEFTTNVNGNVLTVYPKRLQRSTNYVFGVKVAGLCTMDSTQCVGRKDGWAHSLAFKTSLKETMVYGKSVQGRNLMAYFYGKNDANGKVIMLNGGLHGSEWRSGALDSLKQYLDAHPEEIAGKNKTLIITPLTNPDGTALDSRYNANFVNLNRNWPTNPWGEGNYPGSGPLSEPETKALHDLTLAEKVTHIISYHSQWPPDGMIFLGDDYNQDTINFANWVAAKTGYPVGMYPGEPAVQGDQSVWAESKGIRALIIEATYMANSDQEKNFPMQLALIREF